MGEKQVRRPRGPNKRAISLAPGRHPLITQLFYEAQAQNLTLTAIARKAGVHYVTLHKWTGAHYNPSLVNIEACFNALGFRLTPVPLNAPNPSQAPCLSDYYMLGF